MKIHFSLLMALALAAMECPAAGPWPPIIPLIPPHINLVPYSWTTIAGLCELDMPIDVFWADGTNSDARFNLPAALAVDPLGNIYVADQNNSVIRKMMPSGTNWVVTTPAGQPGLPGTNDGVGNAALFNGPTGIAVDKDGNVYVADSGNNTIRRMTLDGMVTTIAGNVSYKNDVGELSGGYQDGAGPVARFGFPMGVAVDNSGNVYVGDTVNCLIRKITPTPGPGGITWQVSTLAGAPKTEGKDNSGFADGKGSVASFNNPQGVAVDSAGNIYVADSWNWAIRKITPDGTVSTLAGGCPWPGAPGVVTEAYNDEFWTNHILYGHSDGIGGAAEFMYPTGVAVDGTGNVFVADSWNSEIRKVTPDGMSATLGGVPSFTCVGSGYDPCGGGYANGVGTNALFGVPLGLAVDTDGDLYVADTLNFVIRKGESAQVQVVALEVTQVIQDWSNSIPLIEGKTTCVRAHLQLKPNAPGPVKVSGAKLYGIGPDGALPGSPTDPINFPDGSLTVQTHNAADPAVRGTFAQSLNFRLPKEWLSGSITLQLAWPGGLDPVNVVPSDCTAQVTFFPVAVPQVKFFAVDWTDAGGLHWNVGTNLTDLPRRVLSCFPVASIDATFGTLPWSSRSQPSVEAVNTKLASMRFWDWLWRGANTIYHGAINANNTDGLAASSPGSVSSGNVLDSPYGNGRQTTSHELGHDLGVPHDVSAEIFGYAGNGEAYAQGACGGILGPATYAYPLFQPFAAYDLVERIAPGDADAGSHDQWQQLLHLRTGYSGHAGSGLGTGSVADQLCEQLRHQLVLRSDELLPQQGSRRSLALVRHLPQLVCGPLADVRPPGCRSQRPPTAQRRSRPAELPARARHGGL